MRTKCNQKGECIFRSVGKECKILDDTSGEKCSFRKTIQEGRAMAYNEKDPETADYYRSLIESCGK